MKSLSSPVSQLFDRVLREASTMNDRARVRAPERPNDGRFNQPGALFLLPEEMQITDVQRFVILVPSESFSVPDLSIKIGRYTVPGTTLLFVARVMDPEQELVMHRLLILFENMFRSPFLQVQFRLVTQGTWVEIAREIYRPGDIFVCLGDHKVRRFFSHATSIGQEIFTDLQVPVLIQQDVHIWEPPASRKIQREIFAWILFILTIAAFFYLQVQIDLATVGWESRVFLILSMFVEFYLIAKINDLFG